MKPSLLELLRSPVDGSRLRLEQQVERNGEIVDGTLVDNSGKRFPIVRGVPLFAEAESNDATFAFKWKRIGRSYGHEDRTRTNRQQWYLDRFGYQTRRDLHEFLGSDKLVLDAGTGSGVDAAMFAESGSTVVAVDLSRDAADATYGHLGSLPNVHVVQGDLCALPFPERAFDYISSDQVLHHTPDTRAAFVGLTHKLRPEGRIAIYVYRRKGPIREFADDYIRERATKMPAEECYELCRRITLLGKALSDLKVDVAVSEEIPLLEIEAGTEDVQRFLYWNVLKCFWNEDYDFETNVIVNFDWYHPKYAFRHEPEEVRAWFDENGLSLERLNIVPSGISAVGDRSE
jgi:SAM-dependent methyltransferase